MILDNFAQWFVSNALFPERIRQSQPKGRTQGNMRIGLYWKSRPVVNTANMEMKFDSGLWVKTILSPWVRISHRTNKYEADSNHNNTEVFANPHEDQTPKTSIKVVAARSKAKAKPQKRELVDTPIIIPMHERRWIDSEPSEQTLSAYEVWKKVISLLRHNQSVHREEFHFEINSHKYSIGQMSVGKLVWLHEEVLKRRYQYCSDNSRTILYFRALQGHSGLNFIGPSSPDNGLFHHIYHIGCPFNLHSIINN